MRLLILNGIHYRWEVIGGGKGLEIENKNILKPYCKIVFQNDDIIKDPEKIVNQILDVLFPSGITLKSVIAVKEVILDNSPEDTRSLCKVCGKVCKSKAGLKAHMRSHKTNKKEKK